MQCMAIAVASASVSTLGWGQQPFPADLAREIRFTIAEIRVEGNTLVTTPELLESVKNFRGVSRSLDDLNGARDAIRAAYRFKECLIKY